MKIMATGKDYSTGKPLVEPLDEEDFARTIVEALLANGAALETKADVAASAFAFRGLAERTLEDRGDPLSAGWTFLVNENDPRKDQYVEALAPLAQHRAMKDPSAPLIYSGQGSDEWGDWEFECYDSLACAVNLEKPPFYILIVGGPDQVPFEFQAHLDIRAAVGRVAFNSIDDLHAYVDKVIRLEKASSPPLSCDTVLFATDGGLDDPTYYSRHYMVEPLIEHIHDKIKFTTHALVGEEATKERLLQTLTSTTPTLVYTASHGTGAPGESFKTQQCVNGAIECHHQPGQPDDSWRLTADDIPLDQPFLEGSIFFQFACYGYGTPAQSDFVRWTGITAKTNADEDFIAAIPRRLLAHPRGPVAYIGHVDLAWLHGFADPQFPEINLFKKKWADRMTPFVQFVNVLLHRAQPVGMAMESINQRYSSNSSRLSRLYKRITLGREPQTKELDIHIADKFIEYSDAANYFIFGDASVGIPAD